MKIEKLLAVVIYLCSFTGLMAEDCNTWEPCLCDRSKWSAQVDWLYCNVRKSGLDYAVYNNGNENPYGEVYEISPEYESGFRVALCKKCEQYDFGIGYTRLVSKQSDSVTSGSKELDPTRGIPALMMGLGLIQYDDAKSRYEFDLNKVHVEIGKQYQTDVGIVRPFAGFQYTSIDQDIDTSYLSHNFTPTLQTQVNEKIDMDAYGLFTGLEYEKSFWCGFGFYGRFSTGLSVAEFDRSTKTTQTETAGAYQEDWLVVPNWELAVGLTYDLCDFSCVDWSLAVGYEFHQWCCLPDFLNFDDIQDPGHMSRSRSNLGYDGLFVRVNAAF